MNPFDIHQISGLTQSEAARRLATEGYHELPSSRRRNSLAIALEVIREPMFLGLVLSVPVLQNLFHFAPLHGLNLALCLLAGAASILWFEILKLIRRPNASRAVTGVAAHEGHC